MFTLWCIPYAYRYYKGSIGYSASKLVSYFTKPFWLFPSFRRLLESICEGSKNFDGGMGGEDKSKRPRGMDERTQTAGGR